MAESFPEICETQARESCSKSTSSIAPLSFTDVCQGAWKEAAARVENGRHLLDAVRSVIQDLEQLEKQHAVNLKKMSNKLLVPHTESSTVKSAVEAFRNDLINRAHQSMQFAVSIRRDVLDCTLEPAIANHSSVFSQISADAAANTTTLADLRENHRKSMLAVSTANKAALRATLQAQNLDVTMAQQRIRAHKIALELTQEAHKANTRYQESTDRLNEMQSKFKEQKKTMLAALEDMDCKRIDCLRDSLLKAFVFRVAQSQNTQYDTKNTIEIVKAVDTTGDVAEFLKKTQSEVLPNVCDREVMEKVLSWPELEAVCAGGSETRISQETEFGHPSDLKADTPGNPAAALRHWIKQTNLDQVVQQAQAGFRGLSNNLAKKDEGSALISRRLRMKHGLRESASHETLEQLLEDVACLDQRMLEKEGSLSAESDKSYERLLQLLWDCDFDEIFQHWGDKGLAAVIEGFAIPVNRFFFSESFLRLANSRNFQLEAMHAFHALCQLCQGLLDFCDADMDFWCGRMIMVWSHQIHVLGTSAEDPSKTTKNWVFPATLVEARSLKEESKRFAEEHMAADVTLGGQCLREGAKATAEENLQLEDSECVLWRLSRGLYDHQLWNRVAFWEEALLLTISEVKQREIMINAWKTQNLVLDRDIGADVDTKERLFRSINPCCQSMCLFAYYMTLFGIQPSNISTMITKMCSTFELGADFANQLLECLVSPDESSKIFNRGSATGDVLIAS